MVAPILCLMSSKIELRVAGKYRLGRKIGSGSFGDIYAGMSSPFAFVELVVWWFLSYYEKAFGLGIHELCMVVPSPILASGRLSVRCT